MAKKETPAGEEGPQNTKEDALEVFRGSYPELRVYKVRLYRNPSSNHISANSKTNDLAVERFHIRTVPESTVIVRERVLISAG